MSGLIRVMGVLLGEIWVMLALIAVLPCTLLGFGLFATGSIVGFVLWVWVFSKGE